MQTIALENKRGFTLIELVIVIVLIGILAATALPKFANLTSQARTAANQGVAGGFSAAVSIIHAGWIANGANSTTTTTVAVEGTGNAVSVSSAGWPNGGATGDAAGGTALSSTAHCDAIWSTPTTGAILSNPPPLCAEGTFPCYISTVAAGTNTCVYSVNTAAGVGTTPATTITYNGVTGSVTASP